MQEVPPGRPGPPDRHRARAGLHGLRELPHESREVKDEKFIKSLNERNIYVFSNYIDLANQLYSLDIITYDALNNIIGETLTDFKDNKIPFVYYQDPIYISYLQNDLNVSANKFSEKNENVKDIQ